MIDTPNSYKNALLVLSLAIILILIYWLGQMEREVKDRGVVKHKLEQQISALEDRNEVLSDSLEMYKNRLVEINKDKATSIKNYNSKSRKEKNSDLAKLGKITIVNEQPCLDSNATDSINKLAIYYGACVESSATKDTLIGLLTDLNANKDTIIVKKDNIIASVEKTHKEYKKAAKTKMIKAAIMSGVIGLIFGLII